MSETRIRLSPKEKADLLLPYVRRKLAEQLKAVALIVLYLILFQTLVLGIAISQALIVALGLGVIVLGLAFFMEGLFLGLMPLGESLGLKLPRKSSLPVILAFSFALGVGVTFAEPAIGVLQTAGASVKAWDAPLLFLMLNKASWMLKWAVGIGVGLSVVAGMLRFMNQWSLKPYLYIGVPLGLALSVVATMDPNLAYVAGLAWDCGGVTTGPVTVPLVIALGIGVSRVVGSADSESGGFGVVTLASLLPVITVFLLGILLLPGLPKPMDRVEFFQARNHASVLKLFGDEDALRAYALKNGSVADQVSLFGDEAALSSYLLRLKAETQLRAKVFGDSSQAALESWAVDSGSADQRRLVFGDEAAVAAAVATRGRTRGLGMDLPGLAMRNSLAALQAILPLVLFLVLALLLLVKERPHHPDELILGVFFAVLGMALFNIGIELGLSKLGGQVGSMLPSSFKKIELVDERVSIPNFDPAIVQTAIRPDGQKIKFFYANLNDAYVEVPYSEESYEAQGGFYNWTPTTGPLFGESRKASGYLLVLVFSLFMGYGATLAEPALNALGQTVENLSAGAFKKSLLMQSVAVGVGIGIAVGVAKIIWGIPLLWLIGPPYVLLILLTRLSTEEYVNIGWDSAGVTTGPITVPLVLSLGLGIGSQVGAVEGFGILATASAFPILSVLSVGLVIQARKRKSQQGQEA